MATIRGGIFGKTIDGTGDDDFIFGNSFRHFAKDLVLAGGGDDTINYSKHKGDVSLFGESGEDTIRGGAGDDYISGGTLTSMTDNFRDTLFGGAGKDKFDFHYKSMNRDTVMDFNSFDDSIDGRVEGKSGAAGNYQEATSTSMKGWFGALAFASKHMMDSKTYMFITDEIDGFLLADYDRDGRVNSGIVLKGLTSVTQFSAADIV